ncbi:glycoside hydrolase superfamily [Aspergillus karnatakaensis]|uniref:putative endoglucanase n=1 Tax=Aspergillus karnatakaensis TaxID=1810916 RepID=UPI003CCCC48D
MLLTSYLTGILALGIPSYVASSFVWFGTNEAGAEFGQGAYPGELGRHYIWPDLNAIATLHNEGMNIFRVAFSMERLVPTAITGPVDGVYFGDLIRVSHLLHYLLFVLDMDMGWWEERANRILQTVNGITALGAYAVLDPHNYGRYYGNIITSTTDFAAFWTILATEFADNELVIFDTNNEYHTMPQDLVLQLNQAAINAIRAITPTQYIFVEGNSWTGAWTFPEINDNMKLLTDPSDPTNSKIIYEMHQYLDSDGSGTTPNCVSSTIGKERVEAATTWLRENGKRGILGEFAGGNNDVCKEAVRGMLEFLEGNSDVWLGGIWWAAGPWWGDYIFSLEPYSGVAWREYLGILREFFDNVDDNDYYDDDECDGDEYRGEEVGAVWRDWVEWADSL